MTGQRYSESGWRYDYIVWKRRTLMGTWACGYSSLCAVKALRAPGKCPELFFWESVPGFRQPCWELNSLRITQSKVPAASSVSGTSSRTTLIIVWFGGAEEPWRKSDRDWVRRATFSIHCLKCDPVSVHDFNGWYASERRNRFLAAIY